MKGRLLYVGCGAMLLAGLGAQASAANIEAGKKLVQSDCTRCHGSEVYSRPDHKIQSLAALKQRIPRCEKAAGVNWTPAQTADVVEYLDKTYYKFGK